MISDRDIAPEFKFKCIFSALNTTSPVPSSSIIYERSQTSLWLISSRIGNSHENNLDVSKSTTGEREKYACLILG